MALSRNVLPPLLFSVLLWAALGLRASGQTALSQDQAAQRSVGSALDFAYNHQFGKADSVMRQLPSAYAQHPAVPLLQALTLQWKYMPVDKNPDASKAYRTALEKAASLSVQWQEKSDEPEAIFFAMMAQSLLGRYWATQDESLKAVNATRKAFSRLKDGMKLMERYPEFYFSTGLYNYYRIRYPEDHPAYNAFLIFFPDGDKQKGIGQMELAAERGLFTRHEANFYLTYIYLHNENRPADGYRTATELVKQYPLNPLYRVLLTEACLTLGRYQEGIRHLKAMEDLPSNAYYKGIAASLEGWLNEKHYRNPERAQDLYRRSLELTKPYANTTNNYRAIAYAGLARLSAGQSKNQQAKQYYQNVEALAKSSVLKAEARKYLKEKA